MKIGMLVSLVREEEKKIIKAAQKAGLEMKIIYTKDLMLSLNQKIPLKFDLLLDRVMASFQGEHLLKILEQNGITTINSWKANHLCNNKMLTDLVLSSAHLPILRTYVAFSSKAALKVVEEIGFPLVIKPLRGSWGRLLAKVNDQESLLTILEHKKTLGSVEHKVYYLQEYIEKPGRDIRVFVLGSRVLAAMYRYADHWITNTAQGSAPQTCHLEPEAEKMAIQAAQAVGADLAGIDLVETPNGEIKILEVNSGVEFHGLQKTTNINIADEIINYFKKTIS